MIRRYFIWRAHKKLARTRYRLDRRKYPGKFRAAFMSHLHHARFWETDADPAYRRRRWRKRLLTAALLGGLIFLIWVICESVEALTVFRT